MKVFKRVFLFLLVFSLLAGNLALFAPLASASPDGDPETGDPLEDDEWGEYVNGDIIEFGTYPQSRVTDRNLSASLEQTINKLYQTGNYTVTPSYNYRYSDDKRLGMYYFDLFYEGIKYRGVLIQEYRPNSSHNKTSADNSYQDEYGYQLNKWYFFKYEPLRWRITNVEEGEMVCTSVIDAQSFHTQNNGNYPFGVSNIRFWLNNSFYETAFSWDQQANIREISLPSDENGEDEVRINPGGTDYALSQNFNVDRGWWRQDLYHTYDIKATATSGHTYGTGFLWLDTKYIKDSDSQSWNPDVYFYFPQYMGGKHNYGCVDDTPWDASSVEKTAYHFAYPCDHFKVDVGDYQVLRGVRPKLSLKTIYLNTDYSPQSSTTKPTYETKIKVRGKGTATGAGYLNAVGVSPLVATPADGWFFDGWYYRDPATGAETRVSTDLTYNNYWVGKFYGDNSQKVITETWIAFFKQSASLTLVPTGDGSGSLYQTQPVQIPTALGQDMGLLAVPDDDSYFVGWYDADGKLLSTKSTDFGVKVDSVNTTVYGKFSLKDYVDFLSVDGVPEPHIGQTPPTSTANIEFSGSDWFTVESIKWGKKINGGAYPYMAADATFERFQDYSVTVNIRVREDAPSFIMPGADGSPGSDLNEVECYINGNPAVLRKADLNGNYILIDRQTYTSFSESTLTVTTVGEGSGTVYGDTGAMRYGAPFELYAEPEEGSYFMGWYVNENGGQPYITENPRSSDVYYEDKMIYGDLNIAARFEKEPITTAYLSGYMPRVGDKPNTPRQLSDGEFHFTACSPVTCNGWEIENSGIFDASKMYEGIDEELTIVEGHPYLAVFDMYAPGKIADDITLVPSFYLVTDQMTAYGSPLVKSVEVAPPV